MKLLTDRQTDRQTNAGQYIPSLAEVIKLKQASGVRLRCFVYSVRRYVHRLVTSNGFDTFIIVIICVSSITLAAEDPVDSGSLRNIILSYIDYAFTALFTIEMLLKVGNSLTEE